MHEVRLQGICTISLNCLSTLQWQIQGRARGLPPPSLLIFRPKWGPKGRENLGGDQSPPPPPLLSKGLDDHPHLISRSGSGTPLVHLEGTSTCVNHVIHFYFSVTSRCLGSNISGSHKTVVLQKWQKKRKNWHVWLSCAWLHSGTK